MFVFSFFSGTIQFYFYFCLVLPLHMLALAPFADPNLRRGRTGTALSDTSDAEEDEVGPLSGGSGVNASDRGSRSRGVVLGSSPPRQRLRSPARGARATERGNGVSAPTSPGGLSTGSGSMWSARAAASPTRCDY